MTVGIGVLCQEGKGIIMAADMRGSFKNPSLKPHEFIGKQYDLPFGFVANTAGTKSLCQSIASELYNQIESLTDPSTILHDHIRNAIRNAQLEEWLHRVDHRMTTRLGMRLSEWKKMQHADLIYRRGQRLLVNYHLEMHIGVAGFDGKGFPVILTAYGNEPPEMDEFSIIGSGLEPAQDVLVRRGQNAHMSFVRSLLHVHEAMEAAKATDRFVGRCDGFVVLAAKQRRIFPSNHKLIKDLALQYSGRDTEPLDDDGRLHKEFMAALFEPGITKAQYAAGKRRPD